MSKHLLGFALAGAFVLATSSAYAVDVRNDDDKDHEILISVWKDQASTETVDTVIKLTPGQSVSGVCTSCIVSLGKDDEADSVAAEDTQVVVVAKGGKIGLN